MESEPKEMKEMKYLIAYDLGTGGIKASLFTENGDVIQDVFRQYPTYFPKARYCEQRPEDWWNGVCAATRILLEESGTDKKDIAAAALSGHSLVAVPLDGNGRELCSSVPIWCDARSFLQAENFFKETDYDRWYLTTGNGDPPETYTLFKLIWMKEHQPELFRQIRVVLGSKDYINYRLTGQICTDPSYASGSGIFDLAAWDYRPEFADAAGIPFSIFPGIRPSDSAVGTVTREAAQATGLAEGTPVACGAVDNTCMSLGARGLGEGSVYTSLGSSSWIAVTSRTPVLDVRTHPFVFAHARKGYYTSAVSIFSAGNSFRWIRDNLCRDYPPETDVYEAMNKMAENIPAGSNGVLFNPTLAGGSAQEPSPYLAGGFMGLTLKNTREDLVRASMEGIAMSLRHTLDILRSRVSVQGEMLLCGGGSKSPLWRRIFSDIYNMPVLKTNIDQNAASLGASALAANAVGLWDGYCQISSLHRQEELLYPDPENNKKYERLLLIHKKWMQSLAELGDMMAKG